jgi:hypothetical protein
MIGLNYVYYSLNDDIILKNYLFFFGLFFKEIVSEDEMDKKKAKKIIALLKGISPLKAKQAIISSDENIFDSPLIKELLLLAFDYEIWAKLCKKKIPSLLKTNQRILSIFNTLYGIDYHRSITTANFAKYTKNQWIYTFYHEQYYDSAEASIKKFFSFVFDILEKSGHKKEKRQLEQEVTIHTIRTVYHKANSSFVEAKGNTITIHLHSKKKTVLYHECTHLIHMLVRKRFSIKKKWFKIQSFNEGAANFFAYNLFDNIEQWTFTTISLKYLNFPKYSYLYHEIFTKGTNSSHSNYLLVKRTCKTLWYTNKKEIEAIYYRFFKFFPFSQHMYLYPKELLYQIWYERIIHSFKGKDPLYRIAEIILYT